MLEQKYDIKKLNCSRQIYDFMRWNSLSFSISTLLFMFSIIIFIIKGFNWGLEFTGGTMIEVTLEKSVDINQIRNILQMIGLKKILLSSFINSHDITIQIPAENNSEENQDVKIKIINIIQEKTKQNVTIKKVEFFGPSIGRDLFHKGETAIVIAMIFIFIYVGIRFEWRLSLGILFSLVHDILITMGFLSFFDIEINFSIIASIMSIISYSLNDSIVVFDRIRENFQKNFFKSSYEIFNISLTQTLHRTLITSGITLLITFILYFFGGSILESFSLTMLIGVFIGTISSIYIASALALKLGVNHTHFLKENLEKEEDQTFFL